MTSDPGTVLDKMWWSKALYTRKKKAYANLVILVICTSTFTFLVFNNGFSSHEKLHAFIQKPANDKTPQETCDSILRLSSAYEWLCWTEQQILKSFNFEERFTEEEKAKMSAVGRHIFLEEPYDIKPNRTKNFTILVSKYGPRIERRFLYWGTTEYHDPFGDDCAFHNCKLTYEDSMASTADAIFIHLHRIEGPQEVTEIIQASGRPPNQRLLFLTDESPQNPFLAWRGGKMSALNGLFNWSMSYRFDTDIPVPYGRTVKRPKDDPSQKKDYHAAKSKLAAYLGSNCRGTRMKLLAAMKKSIPVDVWGGCGTFRCEGHFWKDCDGIGDYRFYLSFESGHCREYITEKLWWNAYENQAVPVVYGGFSRRDYEKLAPPKSFIFAKDFNSAKDLSEFMTLVNDTPFLYNRFHLWRIWYRAVNEHGYFQAPNRHYCRVCEALNANDKAEKVYDNLGEFWSAEKDCTNGKMKL